MKKKKIVLLLFTLSVISSLIEHVFGSVENEDKSRHNIKGEDMVAIFFFSLIAGLFVAILCTFPLRGRLTLKVCTKLWQQCVQLLGLLFILRKYCGIEINLMSSQRFDRFFGYICSCMVSDSGTSSEEDDEDQDKSCAICLRKKRLMFPLKDGSPNLITYLLDRLEIDEDTDLQNMSICQSDLIVCQLKMDSKFGLMQNTVMNRKHSDFCDFCGESIVLTKGAMDASFVDPETGILEDCEVKEFMVHKHFGTTEGYVADKSLSFVKFALNCYHRKTMRRLSLNSCICKACYIILLRKYEASKKDKYYTPHKKRGKERNKMLPSFL